MMDERENRKNRLIDEMREQVKAFNRYKRTDEYKRAFKMNFIEERFGRDYFCKIFTTNDVRKGEKNEQKQL